MALGEIRLPQIFGGICLEDLPYKIKDNQAEEMLNLWANDRILTKRWGQEVHTCFGSKQVYAVYDKLYKGKVIAHVGTQLVEIDLND